MTMGAECKVCGVGLGKEELGFAEEDEFYLRICSVCNGTVCKAHLAMDNPPTCTECAGD